MDERDEDMIRKEIHDIEEIPYNSRTEDDKSRLNDLEDEIRRRHPELQQDWLSFFPGLRVVTERLKLSEPFPRLLWSSSIEKGSIHASSFASTDDEVHTVKTWFRAQMADPVHFVLDRPEEDGRVATASRDFISYKDEIEDLGLTVWSAQVACIERTNLVVEDSIGREIRFSGIADYFITNKDVLRPSILWKTRCVILIQSNHSRSLWHRVVH